jgi:uncharacterized protein with PQ loop repeat
MGLIIVIIFLPALLVGYRVYKKRTLAEKNPWFWSIFSFALTAALVYGALYLYFSMAWER